MYKSKLQEICQKRSWSLPKYSTTKHGLDHVPSFSTTVLVNDMSFQTLAPSNSSKESQNQAAKLAFDHFSHPNPTATATATAAASAAAARASIPPSSSFPQPSLSPGFSNATLNDVIVTPHQDFQEPLPPALDTHKKYREVQHLHKSQLQIYAQKRNMPLPIYTCERVGGPQFRCRVTVGGADFECSELFPTLKEAENAAARAALTILSPELDDSGAYKNLLQEMAQKAGIHLPIYSTQRSGEMHCPLFVSSVEVNGGKFFGVESKTKKQAEASVAKVAYNALKDRDHNSTSVHILNLPSSQQPLEAPELPESLDCRVWPDIPPLVDPVAPSMPLAEDTTSRGSTQQSVKPSNSMNSSSSSPCNGSTDSTPDSSPHQSFAVPTLAYAKIYVYPVTKPVPEGSTLLPFHDENWTAFSPPESRC